MDKALLTKYFQNKCTKAEMISVLTWFENHAATNEGKQLLFDTWEEMQVDTSDDCTDFDFMLDRIHHQMNLSGWKTVKNNSSDTRRRFIRVLRNIAAVLLLPVAAAGFYMSSRYNALIEHQNEPVTTYNEVFSSVDAITKVTLPDGSNVWLNHSSSLRYPAIFRKDLRKVELTGEGYFEVSHDPNAPFIVSAGTLDIKAIGTTFNVLAYPDESRIETSLISGKVLLQNHFSDEKHSSLIEMNPSEMVVFSKDEGGFLKRNISDDRYFSWKDGKLVFNEEPMEEVVKKLSRWFNVEIIVQDPELYELTFTGTFVNETLFEVMELITVITPATYSISARHETGQGTFSKRKVTLYSKETGNNLNRKLMTK